MLAADRHNPAFHRPLRFALAGALVAVFALGAASLLVSRHRALDLDEAEYLQTGWLIRNGQTVYTAFVEDHAPYLFTLFSAISPRGVLSSADARAYAGRARLLCGAAGLLAVVCVSLIAFRISGSLIAPLITAAVLFASVGTWARGIADARHDPPALFLFWLGALLVIVYRHRSIAVASCGIGLVAIAALWNPKWPFESVVVGAVFLQAAWRSRRWVAALAPAALLGAAAVAAIAATVPWREYLFFVFRYNGAMIGYETQPAPFAVRTFSFAGGAFRAPYHLLAFAALLLVLGVPAVRRRLRDLDRPALIITALIAFGALIEIWFVYPYPGIWRQYYLMWSFALAILYGSLVACALKALDRPGAVLLTAAVTLGIFSTMMWSALGTGAGDSFWRNDQLLRERVRPGESVWLDTPLHPVGIPIASYYWFSFNYLVPFSMAWESGHAGQSSLPHLSEADLPICRAAARRPTTVRLVTGDFHHLRFLPQTCACLRQLMAEGRARPIWRGDVYEIAR